MSRNRTADRHNSYPLGAMVVGLVVTFATIGVELLLLPVDTVRNRWKERR